MTASPPPKTASVRRASVFVLTLALVGGMVPLGLSASIQVSNDSSQWTASFPVGLYYYEWEEECLPLEACEDYKGISIVDLDVSDEVEWLKGDDPGDDILRYNLADKESLSSLDMWRVCWYDDAQERIGCDRINGGFGIGEMSWDTAWVRIILLTNLERDVVLDLGRV